MEEKKKSKKVTSRKTNEKKVINKTTSKKQTTKKKKKAFTLIELLAVIIILGILMIIAIPSVTTYISNSRKSSYIDTAKNLVGGARNLVNEGNLEMYDTDTTYYIDSYCIKTENGTKTPYGEFVKSYVVVTFDGNGYDYYWTGVDSAGQGVKKIIKIDKLDVENIEAGLTENDIPNSLGIDGRTQYMIIDESTSCGKGEYRSTTGTVNGETGEVNNPITYPPNKDKDSVVVGDVVKIGTEEFYVVRHDGDDLVLLARYNLKVGGIYRNWTKIGEYTLEDEGYGLQSEEAKGYLSSEIRYGTLGFFDRYPTYWENKVGDDLEYKGSYNCPIINNSTSYLCNPYVYDRNNKLYPYVENYKTYLEQYGITIKEARLLSIEEAWNDLGCVVGASRQCTYSFAYETNYWLGNARDDTSAWGIYGFSLFTDDLASTGFNSSKGIRPVIVI